LYPTDELAAYYPETLWTEFRVVTRRSGKMIGIDVNDSTNRIELTKADIIKYRFDVKQFRREMCESFGLNPSTEEIVKFSRTISWGTWEPSKGISFPITLLLPGDDFRGQILERILRRKGAGEILMTPSRHEWNNGLEEMARENKVLLISLNEIVQMENDKLLPTQEWEEYMAAFCNMVEMDLPSRLHQQPVGNLFAKRGEWLLRFSGQEISLNGHLQGPAFVQRLMMKPHQEVHVEQLWKEVFGDGNGNVSKIATETSEEWNSFLSSGEEVVDMTGRAEYQKRLIQLKHDRADAIMDNDAAWLERINQETETISTQLQKIVDGKGRVRMLGNERDRLRLRIRKNITKMIDIISRNHKELAEHFQKYIEMGEYLVYQPSEPIEWLFE
ncbi:MAG: hypothetical protein LBE12_21165, partial [Planctomycetaceae bacterium]|nr:hypothetical protein [Planctomycetaceae bacterium]